MTKRPMCHSCGDRRAKPLPTLGNLGSAEPYFCSIACAARAGVAEMAAGVYSWCEVCHKAGDWGWNENHETYGHYEMELEA